MTHHERIARITGGGCGRVSCYLGLNKQSANYDQARQALISQLQRYPHIKDPGLDSVWFLQHDGTQLVTGQHQGWLSKNVWDWINARL